MAKGKKTVYFCQNCGHEEAKWLGQCPMCKEWNTFVEERIDSGITKGTTVAARAVNEAKVVPITEVSADDDTRNKTGIKELDRVLGGGIVPGSLVLVGGDPGIGKSTLLLQVCQRMAKQQKILYISGEESQTQIKLRANRMGEFSQNLLLLVDIHPTIARLYLLHKQCYQISEHLPVSLILHLLPYHLPQMLYGQLYLFSSCFPFLKRAAVTVHTTCDQQSSDCP